MSFDVSETGHLCKRETPHKKMKLMMAELRNGSGIHTKAEEELVNIPKTSTTRCPPSFKYIFVVLSSLYPKEQSGVILLSDWIVVSNLKIIQSHELKFFVFHVWLHYWWKEGLALYACDYDNEPLDWMFPPPSPVGKWNHRLLPDPPQEMLLLLPVFRQQVTQETDHYTLRRWPLIIMIELFSELQTK